ncbi:MAG TPA: SDR family NAD(P)-dependent oxidoreductase [Planctomycetota bacterium]|nr:SDR family NAD(P)-dependent oxidoreductase [Planctomycetota bacterium]
MRDRVALITGGTRGIGHGIAARLISSGVHVGTVYHRDEQAANAFRTAKWGPAPAIMPSPHRSRWRSARTRPSPSGRNV